MQAFILDADKFTNTVQRSQNKLRTEEHTLQNILLSKSHVIVVMSSLWYFASYSIPGLYFVRLDTVNGTW